MPEPRLVDLRPPRGDQASAFRCQKCGDVYDRGAEHRPPLTPPPRWIRWVCGACINTAASPT